jgi:raffinose/stachyose/melibiose transport system permease protein
MSSFKTNAEILSSGISLPSRFSFSGYAQALKISPILRYFYNSVIITAFTTALNVLILAMAGYVFARFRFPGKNLLYFVLSLSLVIPMTALLHPVYMTVNALGAANTKAGLVLVYTALNLPISLLILRSSFQSIPASLEEAAVVDGAGFVRTFFQIMMPVAKGGLTSAGVLTFLNCWNEFTFALVLTSSQSARTLPLSLSYFTSQFSFNYTAMFAAITIAVIPSIAVFALFQEQVVNSLVAGAVKG